MNYKIAFSILEIDLSVVSYNNINENYLKNQYRKLALKNHPDKNGNTPESNEKFRKINESYHFLKRELKYLNPEEEQEKYSVNKDTFEYDEDSNISLYLDILKEFMKPFFESKYNEILSKIVNDIILTGKKLSTKLFDDLDRETTLNIYSFLSTNRSTLHLNQETINKIREIVFYKYENVEVYKLNPCINDLVNNNLYKLVVKNELYLVPLWHNESYFDGSGCEILVICEPELPKGMTIDTENNICLDIEVNFQSELYNYILLDESIKVNIGEKFVSVPISSLYMKKEQTYQIKNQGLSKIKKDIYDISEKSDIILNIKII